MGVTPDWAQVTVNGVTNFTCSKSGSSWTLVTDVTGGTLTNTTGSSTGYKGGSTPGFDFIDVQKGAEARVVPVSVGRTNQLIVRTKCLDRLWIDQNKPETDGPRGTWLAFEIHNPNLGAADTVSVFSNLTVNFNGFTHTNQRYNGTLYTTTNAPLFDDPTDTNRYIGTLTNGESATVFYYVDYWHAISQILTNDSSPHVNLNSSLPLDGFSDEYTLTVSSSQLATNEVRKGRVTTGQIISANAAGLVLSTTLGPGVFVGQILEQRCTFQFGNNLGTWFMPASEAKFRDDAYRLVGIHITGPSTNGVWITDTDVTDERTGTQPLLADLQDYLFFHFLDIASGGAEMQVTFYWEVLAGGVTQTVVPWAGGRSGTQYKYRMADYLGPGVTNIPVATQALDIAKSISLLVDADSNGRYSAGDTVKYTVTLTNMSPLNIIVNRIEDDLPPYLRIANATYANSDITTTNSSSVPAVGSGGGSTATNLAWVGRDLGINPNTSYICPSNGILRLIYTATIATNAPNGVYTNFADAHVGIETLGPVSTTFALATSWIGDLAWIDSNGNGQQDVGEPGLSNVTVRLYNASSNLVATTTTATNGVYTFAAVEPGTYFVSFTPPADYLFTTSNVGSDATDSDPLAGTNRTAMFTVVTSETNNTIDAGFYKPAAITGSVWLDVNGNGLTNAADTNGISGVTIQLLGTNGNVVATTTTAADGSFSFTNLLPGSYTVREIDPSGYVSTGNRDGVGTNNTLAVTVTSGQTSNGNYFLDAVATTISGGVYVDLNANGVVESGDTNPIAGVTVTLYDATNGVVATTTTMAGGGYTFSNLLPGSYTVVETDPAGYWSTTDSDGAGTTNRIAVTLSSGIPSAGNNFYDAAPAAITGTVWLDVNGNGVTNAADTNGIGGVLIELLNTNGVVVATTRTGADGTYSFTNLLPGSYTVRETDPTGYVSTGNRDGAGTNNTLSVTVASAQTSSGNYFLDTRPGSIGDRVWLDENADGVQDAGEDGIANVMVVASNTVTGATYTNTTDASGEYLFGGLLPGTYTIRVMTNTLASGLAANQTYDPDTATNHQTTVTLATGQEVSTADFGYNWAPPSDVIGNTGTGAIGDRLWIDADGDGMQDAGEAGLTGVTVRLYRDADTNGTYETLVATTSSDAAGLYVFDGLTAGVYVVEVNGGTAPSGYTQTGDPDYFGTSVPGGAADNRTTTPIALAPGDVFVNADFGYKPNAGTYGEISGTVWFDADADQTGPAGTPGGTDAEPVIAGVTVALIRDTNGNGAWDAGEPIIATDITDANGTYSFPGVPASGTEDYLVWVNDTANVLYGTTQTYDSNGTGTPNISAVQNLTNAGNDQQDFGYTASGQTAGKGLIGDAIFLDRNGNNTADAGEGLEGVTVRLYDTNGVLLASTVTDENGMYYFGGLSTNNASYVVKVDTNTLPFAGLSNTVDPDGGGDSQATVTLTGAAPVNLAQDFGYQDTSSPNSITGTVWNDSSADGYLDGAESNRYTGVTVVLYDTNGKVVATTVTDAQGNYSFTNLPDGSYTVDVTDSGNVLAGLWHSLGTNQAQTADNYSKVDPYTVTLSGGATANADFGYYGAGASLGNRTWLDSDKDGIQDVGESAVTNIGIRLTIRYPDGTTNVMATVSDTNGFYGFGNLLLDEHYRTAGTTNDLSRPLFFLSVVSMPTGLVATAAYQGGNVWLDSGRFTLTDAYPVKGVNAMGLNTADPTQEPLAASFDFGFVVKSTLARLVGLRGYTRDGETIIEWQTAEEIGTAGYYLERMRGVGEYERINGDLVPAQPLAMDVATYEQADAGARSGGSYVYRLIEVEMGGTLRYLGPYQVTIDGEVLSLDEWSRLVFGATGAQYPEVSGAEADPDGDGLSNLAEFMTGSNPLNQNSALKIEGSGAREADGFRLRWQSQSNRFYRIEWTTNLLEGYRSLETGIPATPPANYYLDTRNAGAGSVFYRIVLE